MISRVLFILSLILNVSSFSYAEGDMVIKLPKPRERGSLSLEETIRNRRSERNLSGKSLTAEQISQLLWAAQGITDSSRRFRSAPSAGATYPLEIYLLTSDGLFHYTPYTHSIKKIKDKDLKKELSQAGYGQKFIKSASIDIVICADFSRTTNLYGKRGRNYVYIEAGHAAENVHLQAVSEGLGSVAVGAFSDDKVKELLDLPNYIVPIYIIPVGYIVR